MKENIQAIAHLTKVPAGKYVIDWQGFINGEKVESIEIEKLSNDRYNLTINGDNRIQLSDVSDFSVYRPAAINGAGASISVTINKSINSYRVIDGRTLIQTLEKAFNL